MSTIFITYPTLTGTTYTITSRLGHILSSAENKYGQRDYSYTILGVEINQKSHPRIWYPGNCKHIAIQITRACIDDLNSAVFEVAHEAIHCLSPTGSNRSNVLEEGLATLFSIEYTFENGCGIWSSGDPKYTRACMLVKQLISFDPEYIKKMRVIEPTISLIDKDLIKSINSNVPEDLAISLAEPF